MPRLRPPRQEQGDVDLIMADDVATPTEDIVIELDDEDDLHIELPAEPTPAIVRTEPATPEPDDALRQALEAQRRAEDLARNAARERDDANRELQQERGRTEDARYNSVLTAIAAEQANLEKAESDLAAAMQAADWAAVSKAQRVIGVAAARLDRLEENKTGFDQQRETARTTPPPPPRQTAPPSDLEGQISAMPIPDNAKAWLRSHPEFVTDQGKARRLSAAHGYVTENKGVPQFSQAYFDALDQEFGFKAPPPAPQPAPSTQPAQRRSVPVSAPVSREPPTSSGQRQSGNQITLTTEERLIARNSFGPVNGKEMTNAEKERLYAINKAKYQKMIASGQYSDARHQR